MIPVIGLLIIVAVLAYAWGVVERPGRGAQAARLGRAMSYRFVQARYDSYGNRTATKALVVHMTEGSGTEADVDYLANNPLRGVSVHFVILKTGEIVQMLGWGRIAGSINPNELRTTDDPPYTSPDGARVVYGATLRNQIMGSWINGGLLAVEVGGKAVDGPNQAQSEALVRLLADVRTRYPSLPVLGHRDFTSTKGCPGHKVLWASLGGHGKPVVPPKAPEDPMGVSIKLGSTASGNPLSAFGVATLKGAGHDLISVATSAVLGRDMPDGYPLGLVEKGTLAKATAWGTAGEAVVTYNVDGVQAVSPLRDVTLVPFTQTTVKPVTVTVSQDGKVLNELVVQPNAG
jgi:hypothetical protein